MGKQGWSLMFLYCLALLGKELLCCFSSEFFSPWIFQSRSDRSSPSLDHKRFRTAEIVGTEDSASGKSSLGECFSGLIWDWKSFLRRLSRVGHPEGDVHGGPAQPFWRGGSKGEKGEGNRGKIRPLYEILSILLPAGSFRWVVAGNGRVGVGRQRPNHTRWGGNSTLGDLAMGVRWVCWQQEIQKSGQPGSDGKLLQDCKSQRGWGALSEQGRCGGERCVKSELPSEDRWTSHGKREARKVGMPQKTGHLVRGVGELCCYFFCKAGILSLILCHGFC